MKNILIVSATAFEIAPLLEYLKKNFIEHEPFHFQKGEKSVAVLITGVGLPLTAYAMGKVLATKRYDLAINAGIAGAFNRELPIGEVVELISERFGDLGVEEADGSFTDIHTLGLIDPNQTPFQNGILQNPNPGNFLPTVKGFSVNKVHGFEPNIEAIRQRFPADVETMEGAAFFYACLIENQKFLAIRAISNYVESRNRENWNIPLAIENLNEIILEISKY
ncbi:MAG: futalosine hydrolase [Saprospiraceae bacterium]|nr:futalosine hydrolase [Saprospiraceae bacterium]